jgi:membrane protein implicated in regulation of membrane protease activity
VFAAVSAISLVLFWPLARKLNKKGFEKTNADRYIGRDGIVVQSISNLAAEGQVKVDNQIWTARSANGEDIAEGAKIKVEKIEGVKLIVSPINEEQ